PLLHGVRQTAYQVQVWELLHSRSPSERQLLWDSGMVYSAATSGIAYSGPPLEPQHAYAWRVRVWDEDGRKSPWSTTAQWSQAPVWRAQWIEAPGAAAPQAPLPLFRKRDRKSTRLNSSH